jgi:hypothetical protein
MAGPTQRQGVTAELIENGPNRRGGPLGRLLLLVGHRLIGVGANTIITKKVFAQLTIDSDGCDRYKCDLLHLVRAGVLLRRRASRRHARIRTARRRHGTRCWDIVGSNAQALVKSLHAGFLDRWLCHDRGRDYR